MMVMRELLSLLKTTHKRSRRRQWLRRVTEEKLRRECLSHLTKISSRERTRKNMRRRELMRSN
jgi:hypothetical protein